MNIWSILSRFLKFYYFELFKSRNSILFDSLIIAQNTIRRNNLIGLKCFIYFKIFYFVHLPKTQYRNKFF